jgi:hypothetical protein
MRSARRIATSKAAPFFPFSETGVAPSAIAPWCGRWMLVSSCPVRSSRRRHSILDLAQQPVLARFLAARLQPDEYPFALHPRAVKDEMEVAFLQPLGGRLAFNRLPWPSSHSITVPPPYSPCGMTPSKPAYERVILRPHRQPLVRGIGAGAARDGPAFQHAVHLQPEIEMQPRCRMLLHDEAMAGRLAACPSGSFPSGSRVREKSRRLL